MRGWHLARRRHVRQMSCDRCHARLDRSAFGKPGADRLGFAGWPGRSMMMNKLQLRGGFADRTSAEVPRPPLDAAGNVTLFLQPFSMGGRMVHPRPSKQCGACSLFPTGLTA